MRTVGGIVIAGAVLVAVPILWLVWLGSQVRPTLEGRLVGPYLDALAFAEQACEGTDWAGCEGAVYRAWERWSESLAAICEYPDATGEVVRLGRRAAGAESVCSGDGAIPGSRVVRVVRLPQ